MTWSSATSFPEKIEALQAGRVPIHEPGLQDVIERAGERLRFTLDVGEALDRRAGVRRRRHAPTYSGDPDLSAVWTVVDELPAGVETTLVMKARCRPVPARGCGVRWTPAG